MILFDDFHTPDWDNSRPWEHDPVGYREIRTPLNESMTGYIFTPVCKVYFTQRRYHIEETSGV